MGGSPKVKSSKVLLPKIEIILRNVTKNSNNSSKVGGVGGSLEET